MASNRAGSFAPGVLDQESVDGLVGDALIDGFIVGQPKQGGVIPTRDGSQDGGSLFSHHVARQVERQFTRKEKEPHKTLERLRLTKLGRPEEGEVMKAVHGLFKDRRWIIRDPIDGAISSGVMASRCSMSALSAVSSDNKSAGSGTRWSY